MISRTAARPGSCGLFPGALFFVACILILGAGFLPALSHRSGAPVILGRYSAAYVVFLAAYGTLLFNSIFLFFNHRNNNLAVMLSRFHRTSFVKFAVLTVILFFLLVQFSLYPGQRIPRAAVWCPIILAALFISFALISRRPWFLVPLLRLERLFASRFMSCLVAFGIGALLSLFLLELILRVWQPVLVSSSCFVKDPEIGYRLGESTPGTNSMGFRDRERCFEKEPGVYRIVALGDSFAFGCVSRDENYLALLEQRLTGQLSRPVEIINLGIPSYGPKEELRLLEKLGIKYSPDHVMVNFFVGNDLTDNKPTFKDKILLDGMVFNVHAFPQGILMFQNWYLHHYLKVGWTARNTRGGGEETAVTGTDRPGAFEAAEAGQSRTKPVPVLAEREFNRGLSVYASLFLRSREELLGERFEYVKSFIQRMRSVSEQNGAGFSVVLLPEQMQVDRALRRKVLRENGLSEADYDFEAPSRLFETFGEEEGIPVLDLLPFFKEGCRREKLYFPLDSHWNERGNRIASDAIADLWRNNKR
ncbi:MAG: SGNH/GDSL hydrolase family protein [Candidatus Tritonobacter lacicola]|nr:SGNH/GDSL hydrolase family protein [Candidatus Tritonobacter lacicola]